MSKEALIDRSLVGPPEILDSAKAKTFVQLALSELGIKSEGPEFKTILDRLVLLEKESNFNKYSGRVAKIAELAARMFAEQTNEISPEQVEELSKAAFLHDVGKSGPAKAIPEQQRAYTRLFAVEGVTKETIEEAANDVFDQPEQDKILTAIESLEIGLKRSSSMREFWNSHSRASYELLAAGGDQITPAIRVAVAKHHILDGVDPREFVSAEDKVGMPKDDEPWEISLTEALLILADKYEAFRARSGQDHDSAIVMLQSIIATVEAGDGHVNLSASAIDNLRTALSAIELKATEFKFEDIKEPKIAQVEL